MLVSFFASTKVSTIIDMSILCQKNSLIDYLTQQRTNSKKILIFIK